MRNRKKNTQLISTHTWQVDFRKIIGKWMSNCNLGITTLYLYYYTVCKR